MNVIDFKRFFWSAHFCLRAAEKRHKNLERGLEQVSRYAQRLGRQQDYLILFDTQSTAPWEERGSVEEVACVAPS